MKKKIDRGLPLEELVKGSLSYMMEMIRTAFYAVFPYDDAHDYSIHEIFADHVIVRDWRSSELKTDEYWKVPYSKDGESYSFTPRDQWEIVELTYQPQTALVQTQVNEKAKTKVKEKHRIEERIDPSNVVLLETIDEKKGTRRIRINDLMVAGQINGNKRLYSAEVIEAMVKDWEPHLRESRGSGRLMILTGEVEHPSDKGKRRPEFLETVVRWDTLDWNGKSLSIEGDLILTSKGKDVETLMKAGVNPGGSIRGFGESKIEKIDGEKIEIVQWANLNAADLVGDPSFVNEAELFESINQLGDDEMLEELKQLLAAHPELFSKGMTEAQLEALGEKQLKKLTESLRAELGIGPEANIVESVKANAEKARKFDENQKSAAIEEAIEESIKDLPFGEKLNKQFIEYMRTSSEADSPEQVKRIAEAKRKEYGKIASELKLNGMGFTGKTGMQVIGSVLEEETGNPEFARGAFQIAESISRSEMRLPRNWNKVETQAEIFTKMLLEAFDKKYTQELLAESKQLTEAELSTGFNLPYSVSRALIMEAYPTLVASGIFDVGVINTNPTRLYFETFTGETGYTASITDEVVTGGAEDTWYALAHGRITPDSVVVTSNPAGTTYVEGTDFIIDYAAGRIKFLTAGSINANDVLVDYDYTAIRDGENQPIQRGKITMSYKTIEAAADRLADEITKEAILYSRSQLGYDAVAGTMESLIRQIRRKIDQGLLYMAYSAVKGVASNSTDAWTIGTAQTDYASLVKLMGDAKVKVANRFYEPTFYLMSVTNAERLSNWEGFNRGGFPNAVLNAAGYAGTVKGLPVFSSTEFPDSLIICGNRQLVMHRVYSPLTIEGPFPSYSSNKVIAAKQYYAEEFNVTDSPVYEKGAFVPVEEAAS